MQELTATYSPEDNKLRLYASQRLDQATYERVKAAGFKWAPSQKLFVAPMWTPERADLLEDLCGDIGDEDTSLVERAEERADRFEGYSERREADAGAAREAVSAITAHIPLGQPILVGHHSEARARKDAERIENNMRKAVKLWDTARYWERRAEGALAHAKYKERPDVRHRRIKTIAADKRKQERNRAEAETVLRAYTDPQAEGVKLKNGEPLRRSVLLSFGSGLSWEERSAVEKGELAEADALAKAIARKQNTIAWCNRWIAHYDNRLAYERAMLGEAGGIPADRFKIERGGQVLVSGEWVTVLRVNRKDGQIVSVRTTARYVSLRSIEEVQDYRAPQAEDVEKVAKATKLPPLVNFPSDGCITMTSAEWNKRPKDYRCTRLEKATDTHGAYRYRAAFSSGYKLSPVYLSDAKRVDPPAPSTAERVTFTNERVQPVPPATPEPEAAPRAPRVPAEDFEALRQQLRNGVQVVSAPQLFPTPPDVAARMVELAGVEAGQAVLEPQAGTAALVRAIGERVDLRDIQLVAVEIDRRLSSTLALQFSEVKTLCADFLECEPEDLGTFDRILMNPPFERAQDIAHITHAAKFLKPRGRLVGVCANGPRQQEQLRPFIEARGGTWEELPPASFETSGTQVRTVLVTLDA